LNTYGITLGETEGGREQGTESPWLRVALFHPSDEDLSLGTVVLLRSVQDDRFVAK
jgi:hypothetical protein